MKKILAIIPARAGSKGLPDKNIKLLQDKPLISFSILAALESGIFTKVVVSTDSEEYREIALKYGAEAPFLRPKDLSGDEASSLAAVEHAVDFYQKEKLSFDLIVLLQPTSPLRRPEHIVAAMQKYQSSALQGNETLVSVVAAPSKAKWLMSRADNYVNFCFDINTSNPQRQSGKELYLPNGSIYIVPVNQLKNGFYTAQTLFYEMDEFHSLDIDTNEDFQLAEQRISKV